MAFVFRAQRERVEATTAGPGSYQSFPKRTAQHCCAPFNSSDPKRSVVSPKQKTPGVGDYQLLNQSLGKVLLMSKKHELQVIQMPRQQAVFCSAIQRFPSESKETPGPGMYEVGFGGGKKMLKRGCAAPSKPLVSVTASTMAEMQTQMRSTSSQRGKVSLKTTDQRMQKGSPWSLSKQKSALLNQLRNILLSSEPQKQVKARLSTQGRKKLKSFSSLNRHKPDHFGQKYVQNYSPNEKGQEEEGFIEKIVLEESQQPGPSSYFNPKAFFSIKVKNVPVQYQNFGSNCQRFRQQSANEPGPGQYHREAQPKYSQKENIAGFNMSGPRFQAQTANSDQPSPLHYSTTVSIAETLKRKLINSSNNVGFGTGQRFNQDNEEPGPGPCDYSTIVSGKSKLKQIQKKIAKPPKRPATSKPKQLLFKQPLYEVPTDAKNTRKSKPSVKRQIRAPFGSSLSRFRQSNPKKQPEIENETDVQSQQNNRRIVLTQQKGRQNFLGGREQRSRNYCLNGKPDGPGPADYKSAGSAIQCRSFNILFSG